MTYPNLITYAALSGPSIKFTVASASPKFKCTAIVKTVTGLSHIGTLQGSFQEAGGIAVPTVETVYACLDKVSTSDWVVNAFDLSSVYPSTPGTNLGAQSDRGELWNLHSAPTSEVADFTTFGPIEAVFSNSGWSQAGLTGWEGLQMSVTPGDGSYLGFQSLDWSTSDPVPFSVTKNSSKGSNPLVSTLKKC